MALPGAAAGILWMLFVTGTTISVPALMGSIMAVGTLSGALLAARRSRPASVFCLAGRWAWACSH